MSTITFQNKTINYTITGNGKTLVLLHGFCESLKIWDSFVDQMKDNLRVICIDLPGHGKTELFSDCHTMEFMAETVKAVLDKEQVEKCVMVGHSMGGYVTAAFANQYKKMIKAFGFFHSHVLADSDEARLNREKTIEIIKQDKDAFLENFVPSLFDHDNVERFNKEIQQLISNAKQMSIDGIISAMKGMMVRNSYLELLADTDVPVISILGKEDVRMPYESMMAQASVAKFSEIIVLSDVGHMGFIEKQKELITRLIGFARING